MKIRKFKKHCFSAEPMEVIPFPEDDLLMAARSPRVSVNGLSFRSAEIC